MSGFTTNKLIIVDDEPGVLYALSLVLQTMGWEVLSFDRPTKALNHILTYSTDCDLVITDLRMPEISGMELLEILRTKLPDLPVILISGHASKPEKEKAKALGAWGVLGKPFDTDELRELLQAVKNIPGAFEKAE
ncbi:MAG: response regulator [Bdellovibrionales bacterium]|nr:response regulator [Bdellovibrionales bacterium]